VNNEPLKAGLALSPWTPSTRTRTTHESRGWRYERRCVRGGTAETADRVADCLDPR